MKEIRPAWIATLLFGVIAAFLLIGKLSETVSPEPVALWVAVQPRGSGSAYVGPVEIEPGAQFELYAVVEAETLSGGRVFYTEAESLEFPSGPVAAGDLRRWNRSLVPRALWFTVDGTPPYREMGPEEAPGTPRFVETFRANWAQAWTVSGDLRPVVENYLADAERPERPARFGVQRFHVRMEFFANRGDLVPELRLKSWGAEDLPDRGAEFPAVIASLDGPLAAPSRVFGLAQVESAGEEIPEELGSRLTAWNRDLLAFSRLTVLAEWLRSENAAWESLVWSDVEVGVSDANVAPGDLLQVGDRIVWLLEDRGVIGRVDYDDLCIDFDRGARVLRLGSVFAGEGLVEWARAPSARASIEEDSQ